jgi:hypothetical protein
MGLPENLREGARAVSTRRDRPDDARRLLAYFEGLAAPLARLGRGPISQV